MIPVDYSNIFPEINGYIMRPLLVNPPLCTLNELQDGTYTLKDIEILHQIIELREDLHQVAPS